MNAMKCQVLVVGAGPTGLVLAAELLSRGVSARVIDKADGAVLESRANGLHARTLEVLDMMGIADELIERGHTVRRFRWYSDGRSLGALDMTLNASRFKFLLDVPQHETERVLRAHLARLGGTVEQCTELLSLSCVDDRVYARVQRAEDALEEIEAEYVVGCDGAHSRVRYDLGLSFDGHAYDEDWLLADVRMDWRRSEDEVHALFRSEGAPMICFPLGDHVWRVVLPYSGDRQRQAPTLAEIQELVDRRAPERVVLSDPVWLANFRCQRRSTNVYRRGRVLLAGDAVHVHSPAGGQGMNTGIMDAHNLAWKLALVASGRAPEALLDSYGAERGPVAADVLALTHALVKLGTVANPGPRAVRNTVVPLAGHLASVQRRAVRRISHVHVAYPSSPLTRPDRNRAGVRPGERVPDLEVTADGRPARLYEVLRRGRHVLLMPWPGGDVPPGMRIWADQIEVVTASADLAGPVVPAGSIHLLRPDGYLAARGTAANLTGYLNMLFGADPTHEHDLRRLCFLRGFLAGFLTGSGAAGRRSA